VATQKDLKKEFIAKLKKIDALSERVDNLAKEFTPLKNFV
jgi:cob(I)alamin adenosyltransferase